MTEARLTIELVQRVMGWRAGEGRWITGSDRRWLPLSSFQPTERVQDTLKLLDQAGAGYAVICQLGAFVAEVEIDGRKARARGRELPAVLCDALAHALGIEMETAE